MPATDGADDADDGAYFETPVLHWIDANPALSVVIFFAAGAIVGALIKYGRRGKYESRERPA